MEDLKLKVVEIIKNVMFFIALLAGYILLPQIVGVSVFKAFKLSEEVSMFIGNVTFVLCLILLFYKMFIDKIKDFIKNFGLYLSDGLRAWGMGLLVMFISNLVLAYFVFPGEVATNEELNRLYILAHPVIGFISISMIAPFVEEMIFRFGLRKMCPKTKYFPIISAIAFGLPHALTGMTWSLSVNNLLQLLYVIPYGALGYAFGYIYQNSDNIFASMLMHSLHNTCCFLMIVSFL